MATGPVWAHLVVLAAILTAASALYNKGSGVVELNSNNFDNRVTDSDGVWVVEFYAPWCGHCQQLAPEYKKAANALKGIIGVGAVNCDEDNQLCGKFGVRGFPTIKIFGSDKRKPKDFQGGRTAAAIIQEAQKTAERLVSDRMGGKSSSGSGKSSSGGSGDVVELTESNFQKMVLDSSEPWLVEFFAPWCGHCKNLEPHWKKAASELKGKVRLGAVDATVEQGLAGQYGVNGYPTIKFFPAGSSTAEDYGGGRTSDDIVQWALEHATANLPPPEVVQVTDQSVLDAECGQKPLCVIAFLPHILDCQSKCRNDYIAMLEQQGDKFRKNGWGWLWAEGGAQPDLESALDVGGFGYPAMTVVSAKKMKFSQLTGSFGSDGVHEFLRDLSYGKGRTSPVRGAKMPKVAKTDRWDGKDAEMPVEEDIDLSDIELDDLGDKDEL